MYSILKADKKDLRKAKGVKKKGVVKKVLKHEQHKQTLFEGLRWSMKWTFYVVRDNIYGIKINKISLSAFDSKRWIADDGIHTKAYGYSEPIITEDILCGIDLSDIDLSELDFLNHVLFISLHVRAVELVILVKPIGFSNTCYCQA